MRIPKTQQKCQNLMHAMMQAAGVPSFVLTPFMKRLSAIEPNELIRVLQRIFDTIDDVRDTLDEELELEKKEEQTTLVLVTPGNVLEFAKPSC